MKNELDGQNDPPEPNKPNKPNKPWYPTMKKIVHKAKSFREAEQWDILQHIRMTPEERQTVAIQLRERVFGKEVPDVRETRKGK